MQYYSNRLAFMFILALAGSGLVTLLLLNFELFRSLIPFSLEFTGAQLGLFALTFLVLFDLLIVAIETLFPSPALKLKIKSTTTK